MVRTFTQSDEGSGVYSADGDVLGTVEKVSGEHIHVRPHATLSRNVRQKLGWQDDDQVYELGRSAVDRIEGDEIHLDVTF